MEGIPTASVHSDAHCCTRMCLPRSLALISPRAPFLSRASLRACPNSAMPESPMDAKPAVPPYGWMWKLGCQQVAKRNVYSVCHRQQTPRGGAAGHMQVGRYCWLMFHCICSRPYSVLGTMQYGQSKIGGLQCLCSLRQYGIAASRIQYCRIHVYKNQVTGRRQCGHPA